MNVDWTDKKGDTTQIFNEMRSVFEDGSGRAYVLLMRHYPAADYRFGTRSIYAFHDLRSGEAVFAHAQEVPADCFAIFGHHPGGFGLGVSSKSAHRTRYYVAGWPAATSLRAVGSDVSEADAGGLLSTFSMNAGALFVATVAKDGRVIVDTSTGSLRFPGDTQGQLSVGTLLATSSGAIARRFLVGDLSWVYLRNNGTFETLLGSQEPGVRYVTGAAVDRSADEAIVWAESTGIGGTATDSVLFTSPFAEAAPGLARRRVTAFADVTGYGGAYMIAAHGMAVILSGPNTALLVRVSDGAWWTLQAEPGKVLGPPVWVDDTQVWFPHWDKIANTTVQETLIRFDRSTLGPGRPAQ